MPGRYFNELTLGDKMTHQPSRTVTETDNLLFSAMTHNMQPLHLDAEAAKACLLYTSPSPRDGLLSRMPSSA